MRYLARVQVSNPCLALSKPLLLCGLILALSLTLSASPVKEQAKVEFANARRDDQILGLVQSWLPKLVDEEDYRFIQDQWGRVDSEGRDKWFKDRHLAKPDDPMFHYLWLRIQDDSRISMDGAEAIITQHPDYYWAYRLLASEYSKCLSISSSCFGGHYARERLDAKEDLYLEIFLQGERVFGSDPHLLSALGEYYECHGKWDLLEATAVKLAQSSEPFMASSFIHKLSRNLLRADPARRVLPLYVGQLIELGKVARQDSLKAFNSRLFTSLYWAEDWHALDSLLIAAPELLNHRDYSCYVIPMLFNLGRVPQAIEQARELVLKGYDFYNLIDYTMLDDDIDDPRWEAFEDSLAVYEELASQRALQAREQKKLNQELPPLQITDAAGSALRLSDYAGQTLHLYFWASWDQSSLHQLSMVVEEFAQDPLLGLTLLVNGYDSDPQRAQAALKELAPGMTYYRIADATLEELGIKHLPASIVIGPDGKLDYLDDGVFIMEGGWFIYPFD